MFLTFTKPAALRWIVTVVLLGLALSTATNAPAQPAAPAASFAELEGQLKGIFAQLGALREKFRSAGPDDQKAIAEQHDALAEQIQQILPAVRAAAERELAAAPQESAQQAEFLAIVLSDMVRSDRFEEADGLARFLLDNKVAQPQLSDLAATAAFMTNDFDRAGQFFAAAKKAGTLSPQSRQFVGSIEYYKKLWKEEQAYRAAEAAADDLPRVKFETSKGDIVLELFENEAPNTVANLISLVDKKYYDGLTFHRVLPGFMAQGGCPDGTGGGGPGYSIRCECLKNPHRKHFRGSLSMAKTARPHTGGSQFFLCFSPTQQLDGQHTVFGRVIEGLDVLAELQRRDPSSRMAARITPDRINKATVLRRRDHEYRPQTVLDR